MWILLNVGLLSILGQVVLLRELSVASYGIELIYLLAFGVWLLAGAFGALLGRWPRDPSAKAVGALFFVFAFVLPASIVFVRAARLIFGAVPGAYLPFAQQMAAIVFALAPVSILLGVLFQWAARLHIGPTGTLAAAYGIESVGGLIGGLCATLFFKWGVQSFAVAIAFAFVAALAALGQPARRSNVARGVLGAVTVMTAAFLLNSRALDERMTAWTHPGLIDTADSPYGRVTIARAGGQLSVFDNDALWFDTESSAGENFTHLVLLQHPNPQRVLLLGGGLEGLAAYALEHAPRTVDYVELNEAIYERIGRYLPDKTRRSLAAPDLHLFFTDPRRFLQQSDRFDVVLVAMPEPASGAANRFYTREFFAACARVLNPGGVMGFRLQSSENFWTPLLTRRMVSVYRGIRSVFQHVTVLPGTTNVFLASSSALPSEIILQERLNARHIHASLVSGPYLRYLYTNDRRAAIMRALETGDAPENTDIQPICYQYAAVMWLSKFFPSLGATEFRSSSSRQWIIWASVLTLFAVSRVRTGWRDTLLVALVGFLGMVFEAILILHFQMKNGVVFQDIGILLAGFMTGIATGALAFNGLMTTGVRQRLIPRWSGAALLGGLVLLGLAVAAAASTGAFGGLVAVTLLLGATGALVAALFAYVSLRRPIDQTRLVSPLYSADLLGGCAGSLLASLVLIPTAGLALTARWMAVLALLGLVLL
jgi:spermidine synthase